jgi:hypothetical protein
VKHPEEGVRIFASKQVGSFVELERGLQQVVLCELSPGFFHEVLKREALRQQAPLQRAGAHAQFGRDIFQAGTLAC